MEHYGFQIRGEEIEEFVGKPSQSVVRQVEFAEVDEIANGGGDFGEVVATQA